VEQIERIGAQRGEGEQRPLFVWEPVPDLCKPDELDATVRAVRHVDVVSPNHDELAALFSFEHPTTHVDRDAVEKHAGALLDAGIGRDGEGAVVVRAGAEGCLVLSKAVRRWLPAYHADAAKVVDPTGGGNGFLGGLAVGMVRTARDVIEAARWGSVAASFCIEQVGVPELKTAQDGSETWNGVSVPERLQQYQQRTA
jgi:sugar/nucleoside kinase (ribokinase family)